MATNSCNCTKEVSDSSEIPLFIPGPRHLTRKGLNKGASVQPRKFGQDFPGRQDCTARKDSRRFSDQTTCPDLNG